MSKKKTVALSPIYNVSRIQRTMRTPTKPNKAMIDAKRRIKQAKKRAKKIADANWNNHK